MKMEPPNQNKIPGLNIEDRVRSMLGSQMLQIAMLSAQIEELHGKLQEAQNTITGLVEKTNSEALDSIK